jgi:hypothetical protein
VTDPAEVHHEAGGLPLPRGRHHTPHRGTTTRLVRSGDGEIESRCSFCRRRSSRTRTTAPGGYGRPETGDREHDLAEVFARVARRLEAEDDAGKTQEQVSRSALELVAGCDHAAISLIRRNGRPETVAAERRRAAAGRCAAVRLGEGPCLDAIAEHETLLIDDLGSDPRWRTFGPRAVERTGVTSMLSFRLFVEGDTIGALNLYSRRPDAFDERDRAVGAVLAAHAAIAMVAGREHEARREPGGGAAEQPPDRHRDRNPHGAAPADRGPGVRAAPTDVAVPEQKLRDVAERVIETGELQRVGPGSGT